MTMPDDFPDDDVEDKMRSANEVARRCIVLYAVLAAGHREPRTPLVQWLKDEGLWEAVSPEESRFLLAESPDKQQYIRATWRAEALFSLLWCLGLITEMPSPQQLCDVPLMQSVLPPLLGPIGKFIAIAKLRCDAEINAANDEIYHIHWRVRDHRLRYQPQSLGKLPRMPHPDENPPADSYDPGIVFERHHGLNWVIGYCNQDWDDVTTDT